LAAIKYKIYCGPMEVLMTTALDPKQVVSSEELLMSQVVSQEAVIRLLVEKGGLYAIL
jgi:hypothetical protein